MTLDSSLYRYRAYVISVYDGDTCRVNIDLGFHTWVMNERVRLARINAPELRGETRAAGLAARDHLRSLILDKPVIIETIKDKKGKYGRYLAEIWIENDSGDLCNVNDSMVVSGHAVYM